MKRLLRFAFAISLVLLVSLTAASRSQGADAATTLDVGGVADLLGGGQCRRDDDCDDHNPCTRDSCHRKAGKRSGKCEFKPRDNHHRRRIACDDGNPCTSGDACHAAVCAGVNVPSGTACNDTNACTQSDTCQAGSCTGASPVACAAGDQCHVAGTCDPATGACSDPSAPDGTACDDTDACTRSDSCQSGACAGADPVVCAASDQCHVAGACDPASGACSDPAAPDGTACDDTATCSGPDVCDAGVCGHDGDPRTAIVFASSRDNPVWPPPGPQFVLEIYLMEANGANPLRLTDNLNADSMPALSPDGKGRIVFDSNRLRVPPDKINTSDLFLMQDDGSDNLPQFLVRGSSATWSPDSQSIAFHRSKSGTGQTIRIDLGAPTSDSDIFVAKVCDLLAGVPPTNITNSEAQIDDDASWSPDGTRILWTAHTVGDDPLVIPSQDLWVMNADGSGRVNLTDNYPVEERAPSWSPDGTRIAYVCRIGEPQAAGGPPSFEICVMKADGTDVPQRLTNNSVPDSTPTWSPDGTKILFNRLVTPPAGNQQLFTMNADGTGQEQLTKQPPTPPGFNLFGSFGEIKDGP